MVEPGARSIRELAAATPASVRRARAARHGRGRDELGTPRSARLAVAAAVLTGVLLGATASPAEIRSRPGAIAFRRTVGDGPSSLFTIRADGSGLRRLTPSGSDIDSYQWAPDGRWIAYLDHRGALWLVRPDGA